MKSPRQFRFYLTEQGDVLCGFNGELVPAIDGVPAWMPGVWDGNIYVEGVICDGNDSSYMLNGGIY